MTEKMREEFERTNGRDHRRQPPKGNNYIDPIAHADWESFQKGWKQFREVLVIELPQHYEYDSPGEVIPCLKDCRAAIEAAGVRVQS